MNTLTDLLIALAEKYEHVNTVLWVEDETGRAVRVSDLLRAEAESVAA